jgi:biotin carboxyl carrier protein
MSTGENESPRPRVFAGANGNRRPRQFASDPSPVDVELLDSARLDQEQQKSQQSEQQPQHAAAAAAADSSNKSRSQKRKADDEDDHSIYRATKMQAAEDEINSFLVSTFVRTRRVANAIVDAGDNAWVAVSGLLALATGHAK